MTNTLLKQRFYRPAFLALAFLALALGGGIGFALLASGPSLAAGETKPAEASAAAPAPTLKLEPRVLGSDKAPVTVTTYSSMTCSHCADFFDKILPEIEKKYIDTGKLRLVYLDFPMDGIGLKAAALAHCMPKDQFFPFVKIVYKNQMSWIKTDKPDATLIQYAQMAGLEADKATACVEDTKVLDALVAVRTEAGEKLDVKVTPTFIFSDQETKLDGVRSVEDFSAAIEKVLRKKK